MWLRLILLVALSTPFWNLGHPLWEVDDARYAEIPREMHESGDWLTPRLNYLDYIEKPPLPYWLGALSYRVLGVSEAAARLPLALLSLLGLAGVFWLGSWLFSPATGAYAALILATSLQYFLLGHLLTPDMALCVFLLWTTALALRCLLRPSDARWAAPLAWAAMGLAFLSKGLVGLVLPGAWTLALLFLSPELRPRARGLLNPLGMILFALLVLPWLWAMQACHGDFLRVFFLEHHLLRFLTDRYNRPGPWYYFLGVELIGTLPWTPLALAALAAPLWAWRKEDPRRRQLALWVLWVLAFFSFSTSKLSTYVLPLFPHQALLAAERLRRLQGENSPAARGLAWGLAALALGGALFLPSAAARALPEAPVPPAAYATLGLWGASLLILALARRSASGLRLLLAVAVLALAGHGALLVAARGIEEQLSVRGLSRELAARFKPGDAVIAYNSYQHGIPYYTGAPVDVINWMGELHYAKRRQRSRKRFGDDDRIRALPAPGRRSFVILPREELMNLVSLNPLKDLRSLRPFGPWLLAEY